MKILYCSDAKIPSREANSVHIMKMCQAFAMNNHDVTLLAPDTQEIEKNISDIFSYYAVQPIFRLEKIQYPNIKGKGLIYTLKSARYAKKENPDIIYGRSLLSCYAIGLYTKLPVIFEVHQPMESNGKIMEWVFRHLIKNCQLLYLVAISDALKKYYISHYDIPKNRIIVAHDGADITSDELKPETISTSDKYKLNIGYIGHLYKGKGMEIIEKLIRQCSDYNFHIIGGTENDICFWKNRLKEYDNLEFYGHVAPSQVLQYGKAMDVLLAPYQKNVYGARAAEDNKSNLADWMSPLKLFEYMSIGKPIVCTDLPVLREIIENNYNGILCPYDDITSWCNALDKIAEDPDYALHIGKNGQNLLKQKYAWINRARFVLNPLLQEK